MEIEDDRNPGKLVQYRDVPKEKLPLAESLKDTAERVNFYFDSAIAVQLKKEKNVLVTAHGNSLRALIMRLEHLTPEQILDLNLPTGIPIVYELNQELEVEQRKYLGDPVWIKEKINQVAAQGRKKEASAKKEWAGAFGGYCGNAWIFQTKCIKWNPSSD